MKRGDVVVLRADKIYANYGKAVPYYLILNEYKNNLVTIHDAASNSTIAVFRDDLILISSCDGKKNLEENEDVF